MGEGGASSGIRHFSIKVGDSKYNLHILEMKNSSMLWVNGEKLSMQNLVMAGATKYSEMPSSVSIQGDMSNSQTQSLASKLCKKTGKQFYVSWNLPTANDTMLNALIEKEVFRRISA